MTTKTKLIPTALHRHDGTVCRRASLTRDCPREHLYLPRVAAEALAKLDPAELAWVAQRAAASWRVNPHNHTKVELVDPQGTVLVQVLTWGDDVLTSGTYALHAEQRPVWRRASPGAARATYRSGDYLLTVQRAVRNGHQLSHRRAWWQIVDLSSPHDRHGFRSVVRSGDAATAKGAREAALAELAKLEG